MAEDRDLSRLPQWAQSRIEVLERDLASAYAKLAAGPGESDTFADPYGEAVRPLGTGTMIRFGGPGYDRTVDARWRNGELVVQANAGMTDEFAIKPQASNTIRLGFIRRDR